VTFRIRSAAREDLPSIDRLFRESFRATFAHLYAPEDLASFLGTFTAKGWQAEFDDPSFAFQVGERDGEIVGYCKVGPTSLPHTEPNGTVELRQLYLGKDAQGSGLAQALMDWALDEARRRRARQLYLSVYVANHRAKRFYTRYGFEEIGPYAFMVGNHADEDIVMRLSL
jgi:ribosomal protein S18 acetylase RimI-like enzyme